MKLWGVVCECSIVGTVLSLSFLYWKWLSQDFLTLLYFPCFLRPWPHQNSSTFSVDCSVEHVIFGNGCLFWSWSFLIAHGLGGIEGPAQLAWLGPLLSSAENALISQEWRLSQVSIAMLSFVAFLFLCVYFLFICIMSLICHYYCPFCLLRVISWEEGGARDFFSSSVICTPK